MRLRDLIDTISSGQIIVLINGDKEYEDTALAFDSMISYFGLNDIYIEYMHFSKNGKLYCYVR